MTNSKQHHKRSLLQVTLVPAVAILSQSGGGLAEAARTRCKNDSYGGGQDTGCTPEAPICVDANQQEPRQNKKGVQCVPCLNEHSTPMEPDFGCPSSQPLCVVEEDKETRDEEEELSINNDINTTTWKRPLSKHGGTACVAYPCRNTKAHPLELDEGCTESHPICVDGLRNDPPKGQEGIQCVKVEDTDPISKSIAHGQVRLFSSQTAATTGNSQLWRERGCLLFPDGSVDSTLTYNAKSASASICTGCPFGQSKQCDLGSNLSW